MDSIKVLDLSDRLTSEYGLSLFDNIYVLLHYDSSLQHKTFKSIIIRSLIEYAKYYPLKLKLQIPGVNRRYTFKNNFSQYLASLDPSYDGPPFPEDSIELIPTGIYSVKNYLSVNAQWWKYNIHTKELVGAFFGNSVISYFTDYPYKLEISEGDNKFTEDSRIYYLDIDKNSEFITFLMYKISEHVKGIIGSIKLNFGTEFIPNIDSMNSDLKARVEEFIETRSFIYEMYRK